MFDHGREVSETIERLMVPAEGAKELEFATRYAQPQWSQFKQLIWRNWMSYTRNPAYNGTRFVFITVQCFLKAHEAIVALSLCDSECTLCTLIQRCACVVWACLRPRISLPIQVHLWSHSWPTLWEHSVADWHHQVRRTTASIFYIHVSCYRKRTGCCSAS